MKSKLYVYAIVSLVATSGTLAQTNAVTGSCQTQRLSFDATRILDMSSGAPVPANLDLSKYDFIINYGSGQVAVTATGALQLTLSPGPAGQPALGTALNSTRLYSFARVTAAMSVPAINGVVSSFTTMSPRGDEIDFEWTTSATNNVQTNNFYKGILEYNVHLKNIAIPNGITSQNSYTIDWTSTQLNWDVNGAVGRTLQLNSDETLTPMTPAGERWYPTEPSRVQFSIWDAGSSPRSGTSQWAGGPIPWGSVSGPIVATVQYLDIQCYDNNNQPVAAWPPVSPNNPPSSGKPNPAPANGRRFPTMEDLNAAVVASATGVPLSSPTSVVNPSDSNPPNSKGHTNTVPIVLSAALLLAVIWA